ncbi:MAG: aminopeptidase P family protein [Rhodovarius sp.]|nr:aminopeptidase P family protein [Rhodovarius sp.]MDW8314255.1 aminopeptidase P family protein [Rhodovarius sp.]
MTSAERLAALRAELAREGLDGFLIPRADEYLGEYVPPSAERLAWISGFTGSAGLAIVLKDRAVLFTDGRYTTQAALQTDPALWERRHLIEEPPGEWLHRHAPGARIGYDPWLHTEAWLARLSGVRLVPVAANPIDRIWTDRPPPPAAPVRLHPLAFAGRDRAEKLAAAAAELRAAGHAAAVLADPHSIAWLLNIRGGDLPHTPLALGFALLLEDGRLILIMEEAKLGPDVLAALGPAVTRRDRSDLAELLAGFRGRAVRCDPDATPAWFPATLRAAGAEPVAAEDPCRLPRACKNPTEQAGARAAHRRDGVAMARFLAWFAAEAPAGGLTEVAAARRLLALRREQPLFQGESFPAISAAGENGAIVHYRALPEADRPIRPDECYLIDSGGQYLDGTTDITRTLWSGPGPAPEELRLRYTLVLRGHIALATARFPRGVAGPHLDALARRPLWDAGLDYDHGTGHGVGSFLSVHEGPAAFSRSAKPIALAPGMILSDEPGFYLPGAYGIRIENLLLVREAEALPGQTRPFLEFETLTLAPYARALIEPQLLSAAERAWVDAYHARVLAELGPALDEPTRGWLAQACAPL